MAVMALLVVSACGGGSTEESDGDSIEEVATSEATSTTPASQSADEEDGGTTDDQATDDQATAEPVPVAERLYPIRDGRVEVPSTWPVAEPLTWLLDALAAAGSSVDGTTEEEVGARFTPGFLQTVPASQVVGLMATAGPAAEGFEVVEVTFLTPISARLMIGDPSASQGFLVDLQVEYSTGRIALASINAFPYEDGNTYAHDAAITFDQAMARLGETATGVGVVVARLDGASCQALEGHNADQPLATGSNFKGYVLGALATAVEAGRLSLDTPVVVTEDERAPGSFTDDVAAGTQLSLLDAAVLMMGNSDNTMTDHLHELVGREAVDAFVVEAGHADPDLLIPLVSVNEWDNLIFSIDATQATSYLSGSNAEQLALLDEVIAPMGSGRQGGFANYDQTLALSWQASPLDMCRLMARLRQFESGTEARRLIDAAYGAGGALAGVRRHWDITWYKGGGIPTADGSGLDVLTHGWMVEDQSGAYAVVVMGNGGPVEQFDSASVSQRLHRILRDELS